MTDMLTWADVPRETQIEVLRELGYEVEGDSILDHDGRPVLDRYTSTPVRIDSLLIVPGSILLLDDNPISIASYFEEFGETL